jgi:hypothetical protein
VFCALYARNSWFCCVFGVLVFLVLQCSRCDHALGVA